MWALGARGAWLAAVALSLLACSPPAEEQPAMTEPVGPVVLIGVDGLEWDVVLPLLREGRLPALEGLMRRGSFGTLSTLVPTKSPLIWTTVATGKVPSKHGILDFARAGVGGEWELYSSADRTTKALWNILSDAGQSSVVVGWWNTFPVEAISGVMVAPANTLEQVERRHIFKPSGMEKGVSGQVHPPAREDEVLAIVEAVDRELPQLLGRLYPASWGGDDPPEDANWQACRWSLRADESVRRIALDLAGTRPFPNALLAYFGAPDVVGHLFWRFHEPEAFRHPPSAALVRELGGVIARTYEHADTVLGELVARIPKDAVVIVMSDHGMTAAHVDDTFEATNGRRKQDSGAHWDGRPGVIVAAGPPIRRADLAPSIRELRRDDLPRIGNVADITPTILALRGVPLGRDMDGTVLEDILKPGVLEALGPDLVATHDTPEWLAERAGLGDVRTPGEEERLEQLRSLGYLAEAEEATE
jgi:hypothetical protein